MKSLARVFLVGCVILVPRFVYSLELWNMELVLEIPDPYTTSGAFGSRLVSGDVNGDGF